MGEGLNCVFGADEVGGSGAGDELTWNTSRSSMSPSSVSDHPSSVSVSVDAAVCGLFKESLEKPGDAPVGVGGKSGLMRSSWGRSRT